MKRESRMPEASEWKATENTRRSYAGMVVMHGGPMAGSIPEHSHREVEVSVHFRSHGPNRAPVARHAHLYPPRVPHRGGWRTGHEVVVFSAFTHPARGGCGRVPAPWAFRNQPSHTSPGPNVRRGWARSAGRISFPQWAWPVIRRMYWQCIGWVHSQESRRKLSPPGLSAGVKRVGAEASSPVH